MRLGYKIARRFLRSNLGQTFLIILGIGIGVSVQIFIGSLISGLQESLIDKTIGNSSHITISSNLDSKEIIEYDQVLSKLLKVDERIKVISPASDRVAFVSQDETTASILIRGFQFTDAEKIYDIEERLLEGRLPQSENEIILGIDFKNEYKLNLNDEITIATTSGNRVLVDVVGFFDFKVASINNNWAITTLDNANNIVGARDSITSIELQLAKNSVFEADEIAINISQQLGDEYKVVNWKEQNEQLLSGLEGQSISSLMIQIFVLISVVLGIASVLAITVMQKSRQIGILKAMGLRNKISSYVFLFEGLILGFFGAIVGIALGLLLSYAFTTFATNPDGTPIVALSIEYSFIAMSGIIAIVSSIFASLIPAIRSMKLNPIDIIKNN